MCLVCEAEWQSGWYKRNKAKCNAASVSWRKRNPAKVAAHKRKAYPAQQLNPLTRASKLIQAARCSSRKRGHPLPELTREDILGAVERGTCSVSGFKFDFGPPPKGMKHNPLAPSLDRPDSRKPYSRDNFRIVCWAVNMGCSEWGLKLYLQIAAAALGVQPPP